MSQRMNIKFVGNTKIKRSLLSCDDCRRRKKRCDELKPKCSSCIKRTVECVYTQKSNIGKSNKVSKVDSKKLKIIPQQLQVKQEVDLNHSLFNFLVDSTESPSLSLSPLFQLNIDNISISPFLNSQNLQDIPSYEALDFKLSPMNGLVLDLDFLANSIINSSSNDDLKNSYKFAQMLTILKPLCTRSTSILFSFAAILLALKNDDRFEQFVFEAKKLSTELKLKIDASEDDVNDNDLINYIVTITCLSMIASFTGDSAFWKETFEQLYEILKNANLKHILSVLSNGENKNTVMWVVHWFFQQDLSKIIKVTNLKKIGPVFTKLEYQDLLLEEPNTTPSEIIIDESISPEQKFKIDPILSCCYELYLVLGGINKTYDEFSFRITGLIDYYYKFIKPIMDQLITEEEKIEFLNSETYSKYEDTRIIFHDWVQFNTSRIEDKIVNCTINTSNINNLPDIEIEKIIKFFTLFQRTILLYLKIKLKELSTPSYEIKQLLLHMFKTLRELSGTNLNDYLLFPLLIVGASVSEYRDRLMVKSIYLHMNESTKFKRNLNEIWKIILDFWEINPNGVTFHMWQNAINKLDWNICLV